MRKSISNATKIDMFYRIISYRMSFQALNLPLLPRIIYSTEIIYSP